MIINDKCASRHFASSRWQEPGNRRLIDGDFPPTTMPRLHGVGTIAHAAVGPWYTGVPRRISYVSNFVKLRLAVKYRAQQQIRLHKHDRAGSCRHSVLVYEFSS